MEKRRVSKVVERTRPDVSPVSSISRSKPSIAASSITARSNSIRQSIQGLSTTPKNRNRVNIEAPTTKRATSFFSISNGGSGRLRPQVQAISGTTPRTRVTTSEMSSPNNSIVNSRSGIENLSTRYTVGDERGLSLGNLTTFSGR